MRDTLVLYGQGTTSEIFFYTGFCPGYVKVIGWGEEDMNEWCPLIPEEYSIETIDTTGARAIDTGDGIRLVKFDDEPGTLPGSGGTPSDLENGEWYKANGIEITGDCLAIVSGNPFCVIVHRMTVPMVRAKHDGTDNSDTYFEDSSIDFLEAGISGNGKFILINEDDNKMCYVGKITKPAGKDKYCRIYTYLDENLANPTTSADSHTDDIAFIIPRQWSQHPLITAMT